MHRLLLFALVLSAPIAARAQNAVRITDPSAIVLRPDLQSDAAAQAGMKAAGLSESVMTDATRLSEPAQWPVGLRSDSARAANKTAIGNYSAYLVCEYATEEGALSIVSVPSAFNYHMPDDLRAAQDLYLVVRSTGVQASEAAATRQPASKGPAWRGLRPAKILKPDGVYATFDLGDVTEAMAALEKQGLSESEVDAVVFRSHERNWPNGIDSFEKRYPKLASLKKYKAYRLARWGEKVLLVIPAEANKKAPEGLRPYLDIYMVFDATAVKVAERRK
ncbi:MAG: hypothetical protein IPM46_12085 [Flavobacteriales bacterium]|nr:hypothetical protein [Flavobacteriales bacterium]